MMNDLKTPIRRLTDTLPYLLDPKVGIITSINEHAIDIDSPRFFRFIGSAANTEAFNEFKNFAVGGGAATTRELALAKTVGEAVERYCPALYDKEAFPLYSYKDAPFPCIHPKEFTLYNKEQHSHDDFVFDEFTEDAKVRWVEVNNITSQTSVWVPAAFVYVPYFFYENGDEAAIGQSISTGLSCHCSYEEAVVGGICEVIERDNFMMTWQAKMSRSRIRLESLSEKNKDLVSRFTEVGYDIHLMDISNESKVPGVLAVATNTKSKFVPLVVAASAALSPEEAIAKSLEELAHTERYANQIRNELPRIKAEKDFDNIIGQIHHVNFWTNPEVTQHAEFLYNSAQWIDFQEMPDFSKDTPLEELQTLIEILKKTGYDVLIKDITTPDIKSLGMHVIRAMIPQYHPMFMGYHNRPLGGKRLWTIPQKLGFKGITPETGDYPFPHPFP